MVGNLNQIIDQVSKEKNVDRSVLVNALEQAILSAAKKNFGPGREFEVKYAEEEGQVDLILTMVVVEDENLEDYERQLPLSSARVCDPEANVGDVLCFQVFYLERDRARAEEQDRLHGDILGIRTARQHFGRIAAMTAKQVITQKVREAERDVVYNEYKDRKSELVTGIVRRFERGNVIVDLGRAEAVLPVREQMFRESYRAGDRVQAYVKDIKKDAKGPQIVLSRTDDKLIEKLFELEVPEIYEGIVKIIRVAREPGERAKIAVASKDSDVDPVGACVGMKGSRVQAVVQELKGEKIDIVPWSPDTAKFVCNAIQPAEVSRVLIDEDNQTIELIVPDEQLSLAIGRRGQNVRLATKLVGWKIDIQSESKIEESKKMLAVALAEVPDLDETMISYLFKLGYHSPENLTNAHVEDLAAVHGITQETAMHIQQIAHNVKRKRDEELRAAKERAAAEAAGEIAPEPAIAAAEPEAEAAGDAEVAGAAEVASEADMAADAVIAV